MSTFDQEQTLNQQTFQRLQREVQQATSGLQTGQYVGIVRGQVVATSSDFAELLDRLNHIEPDPSRRFVGRVGEDYDRMERVL